jgi:hypothetical protein
MVVTIEPGIYVRAADDVPKAYRNIGIRIEDDALLTADGCELLTSGVPKAADEIEALMAGGGGSPAFEASPAREAPPVPAGRRPRSQKVPA